MRLFYRASYYTLWPLARALYRHQVYGLEHLQGVEGGTLVASSHASFLDPMLIGISFPKEMHFLARDSLFDHWLLGPIITRLNAHRIHGVATVSAVKTVSKLLRDQQSTVIFPEGMRSKTGELLPVQKGVGVIAGLSRCTVVPCYMHGTYDVWPPHERFPKCFGKTACVFGSPLPWSDYEQLGRKNAQDKLCQDVEARLHALKRWYEAGARGSPP